MLTTPGGMPASSARRASSIDEADVISDGFSTMVLPAASAGASDMTAMKAAEVIEPVLRDPRLRAHLGEELAVLSGLDRGDAIGVLGNLLAPFHQQPPAPGRRQRAPRAPKGGGGRGHGAVHFVGTGKREGPPHRARGGIEGSEGAAVRGRDVTPVDVIEIVVHETLHDHV